MSGVRRRKVPAYTIPDEWIYDRASNNWVAMLRTTWAGNMKIADADLLGYGDTVQGNRKYKTLMMPSWALESELVE